MVGCSNPQPVHQELIIVRRHDIFWAPRLYCISTSSRLYNPQIDGLIWSLMNSPSWLVGFSNQTEAMDVCQSAPHELAELKCSPCWGGPRLWFSKLGLCHIGSRSHSLYPTIHLCLLFQVCDVLVGGV